VPEFDPYGRNNSISLDLEPGSGIQSHTSDHI